MAQVTTLFEHDCTIGFDWTDKDLVLLDRLGQGAGVELLRPVVRRGRRELVATQHVGVFRLGNRTVQVLPKIYRADEATDVQQHVREATRNLLYMLQIADEVSVREQGFANLLKQEMDWFEVLTRLFTLHLREEWQRGASRGYQPAFLHAECKAKDVVRTALFRLLDGLNARIGLACPSLYYSVREGKSVVGSVWAAIILSFGGGRRA